MDFSSSSELQFELTELPEKARKVLIHISDCDSCIDRLDPTQYCLDGRIEFVEILQNAMFEVNHPLRHQNLNDFLEKLELILSSDESIDELENVQVSSEVFKFSDTRNTRDDAECCICLAEFKSSDVIRKSPCDHIFHLMCINNWLEENDSCPLCRANFNEMEFCDA